MHGNPDSEKPSPREKLEQDLIRMIRDVDEEGLVFLTKQAHVILHNMQVDQINQDIEDLEKTRPTPKSAKAPSDSVDVIESDGGSSYVLVIQSARKILSVDELRSLVRICHDSADAVTAAARVYTWLSRERRDILLDAGIQRKTHPALRSLYELIKRRYKPKPRL